jgi:hypothetical protein
MRSNGPLHQVTLKTPPKGDHFAVFHGPTVSANASISMPPQPMMASPTMSNPYGGYGWHPYGMMAPPPVSTPITPARVPTPPQPSSDPPDSTAVNPYPLIDNFIANLASQHVLRNFIGVTTAFAANDYIYIDEILTFSKAELMGAGFHLSGGNAKFILEQVDYEMLCTERANGFKRRRVRA